MKVFRDLWKRLLQYAFENGRTILLNKHVLYIVQCRSVVQDDLHSTTALLYTHKDNNIMIPFGM